MSAASLPYTLANGVTADADQVMSNFTSLLTYVNGSVVRTDGVNAMTAALTLSGDPSANDHASRKLYVDRRTIEPQFFATESISNGTATSFTAFATHNNILTAPRDLIMVVLSVGAMGFSGVANAQTLQVQDEAGADITHGGGLAISGVVASWQPVSVLGKKTYASGATCGYRLAYKVDASNVYVTVGTMVAFYPND